MWVWKTQQLPPVLSPTIWQDTLKHNLNPSLHRHPDRQASIPGMSHTWISKIVKLLSLQNFPITLWIPQLFFETGSVKFLAYKAAKKGRKDGKERGGRGKSLDGGKDRKAYFSVWLTQSPDTSPGSGSKTPFQLWRSARWSWPAHIYHSLDRGMGESGIESWPDRPSRYISPKL